MSQAAIGKTIGIITDYGIDTAAGAAGISAQSEQPDAYRITGEVIGVGANIGINLATNVAFGGAKVGAAASSAAASAAASGVGGVASNAGATLTAGAATGPGIIVAVAIVIAQVVGAILDAAWNPFQNYFNSDLEAIRKSIKSELQKELKTQGLNWPLEVKPNLVSFLTPDDPNYETNIKEFKDNIKKYYEDNGIITQEDVLQEENLFINILQLRRQSKQFRQDENGNLIVIDPVSSAIELQNSDNNNMLLLLALAVNAKKNKSLTKKTNFDKFINNSLNFLKFNWQIFIIILLLFFFSSIIIIR